MIPITTLQKIAITIPAITIPPPRVRPPTPFPWPAIRQGSFEQSPVLAQDNPLPRVSPPPASPRLPAGFPGPSIGASIVHQPVVAPTFRPPTVPYRPRSSNFVKYV